MSDSKLTVAVIMQRRPSRSRWQTEVWESWAVLAEFSEREPALLHDDGDTQQWLHPGVEVALHRDECEGYWLNVSSPEPRVFVKWSLESGRAVPEAVSLNYDRASRWLDADAQVDSVAMSPAIHSWLEAYVKAHYRPEPKKRVRAQSFRNDGSAGQEV